MSLVIAYTVTELNEFAKLNTVRLPERRPDKDNALTEELSPTVTLYRNSEHASYIALPFVGQKATPEADLDSLPTQKEEFPPLAILSVALGIIIPVIFLTFYMRKRIGSKK